jgi:hypothetical protein
MKGDSSFFLHLSPLLFDRGLTLYADRRTIFAKYSHNLGIQRPRSASICTRPVPPLLPLQLQYVAHLLLPPPSHRHNLNQHPQFSFCSSRFHGFQNDDCVLCILLLRSPRLSTNRHMPYTPQPVPLGFNYSLIITHVLFRHTISSMLHLQLLHAFSPFTRRSRRWRRWHSDPTGVDSGRFHPRTAYFDTFGISGVTESSRRGSR